MPRLSAWRPIRWPRTIVVGVPAFSPRFVSEPSVTQSVQAFAWRLRPARQRLPALWPVVLRWTTSFSEPASESFAVSVTPLRVVFVLAQDDAVRAFTDTLKRLGALQ